MILSDKEIAERSDSIFNKGYNPDNVQAISYDIHIEDIIGDESNVKSYALEPHDVVMVKCMEEITVPDDLAIRVENKNSLIRLGLTVTAPLYNPGHHTAIYLRVENVSANNITIGEGMAIAQLVFEKLSSIPARNYSMREDSSFNDESSYRGLGKYKDVLEERTEKAKKAGI